MTTPAATMMTAEELAALAIPDRSVEDTGFGIRSRFPNGFTVDVRRSSILAPARSLRHRLAKPLLLSYNV